jgi:predicted dehydrogenase
MLRIALFGAGIMGSHHARLSTQLRDAEVAFVVDEDAAKAGVLAASIGAKPVADWTEVTGRFDAAIVATPSESHAELALALINAGKHVLVEKPLATTVEEAERLVAAAEQAGVVLTVGHVERFNPAVLELDEIVSEPLHLGASRISPYSPRVRTGVVLDLMIHDLDIVRSLARSEVRDVFAVSQTLRSDSEDLASAVLQFDNGVTADLTVSRVGQQKIRTLAITEQDRYVSVDLLRQDVTINRVDHHEYVSSEGSRYRQTGMVEIPFLENRGEPLFLEQNDFVRSITTRTPPKVSGRDGVEALRLAYRVLEATRGR